MTDTTCCIPPDLIKEYDIRLVSVTLFIDGNPYRDQFDIASAEFWKKFKEAREMPTTAAVNPEEFLTVFEDMSKEYEGIVCILVAGILSATYNAAVAARERFQEQRPETKTEVIDSKCSAGALGFLVLEAARAARAGKGTDEVVKIINDMLPKVTYLAALATMKYLIKGGRAPKKAVIGDLLQVKPIIIGNKETGLIDSVGRPRGKRKAMQMMVDIGGRLP